MAHTGPGASEEPPIDPALVALLREHDLACPGCGYNLRGLTGKKCPECGLPVTAPAVLRLFNRPATTAWCIGAVGLAINVPLTIFGWCCYPATVTWAFLPAGAQIVGLGLITIAVMAEWTLLMFWFDRDRSILNAPAKARVALAAFVWWPAALLVVLVSL